MKFKLCVPDEIRLVGCRIEVVEDKELENHEEWGKYYPNLNMIGLYPNMPSQTDFENFCHELSEAIADKFVNTDETRNDEVPHKIIDAYGRGIFNFLVDNIDRMLEVDDEHTEPGK